jgi:glutathione S-transferase
MDSLASMPRSAALAAAAATGALLTVALRSRCLSSARAPPELVLYGSAKMFRSFRNIWMLEEMGLPFVHEPAKPRSAEARASNPFGKIPTLRDGTLTVYESVAINTHLGDRYRDYAPGCAHLVPPAGTDDRARYETLACCLLAELDAQALWIHRKHASEVAKYIGAPNAEATEVGRRHAAKVVDVVAAELAASGGDYLLGAHFSAVDILLVHCCDWAEDIGWGERWRSPDDGPMHTLSDYLRRCRAREAYLRAKARP